MKFFKSFLILSVLATYACQQDAGDKIENMADEVQDEACKMVNGKLECAAKKVKRNVEDAAEKLTN